MHSQHSSLGVLFYADGASCEGFLQFGMIQARIPGYAARQCEISSLHREIENSGLLYQNGQEQDCIRDRAVLLLNAHSPWWTFQRNLWSTKSRYRTAVRTRLVCVDFDLTSSTSNSGSGRYSFHFPAIRKKIERCPAHLSGARPRQ